MKQKELWRQRRCIREEDSGILIALCSIFYVVCWCHPPSSLILLLSFHWRDVEEDNDILYFDDKRSRCAISFHSNLFSHEDPNERDVRQRRDFSAEGWRWSPIESEAVVFTRLWFENICCCFCDYFLKYGKQSVLCVYVLIKTLLISSVVFFSHRVISHSERKEEERLKRGESESYCSISFRRHPFEWILRMPKIRASLVTSAHPPSLYLPLVLPTSFTSKRVIYMISISFSPSLFSICMFEQEHVSLLYIPIDTIYFLCTNFNEILLSSSLTYRFSDESSVHLTVIFVFACFQVIVA